jgi:hypothetical protein
MGPITSLVLLCTLAIICMQDSSPRELSGVCFCFAIFFLQPNGYFISAVLLYYAIRLWWTK